jgi:hypothetical protein
MTISSLNPLPLAALSAAVRNNSATMPAATAAATTSVPSATSAPPSTATPSVVVTLSGATTAAGPVVYSPQSIKAPPPWQDTSLAIRTASGRSLTLTLQEDGDSFAIKTDGDAPLSDAEASAVAKLADAMKAALDGMTSSPPRLDLEGLAGVDTGVLSSVHLSAQATDSNQAIQTLDFTADATSRAVKIDGPAGKIDVRVDLSSPASMGSKAQQASAISNYLKQFDQTAARGHADPALMTMFKDAFTQLHAPAGLNATTLTRPSSWLNATDHALLSGLADFSASITQTAIASNPYRADEHDAFSLQVTQITQMSGRDSSERGITQTSSSQMKASFHSALSADFRLNLTEDPKSQNYYYTQSDDSAQSTMKIGYQKGRLVQASLSRTASQQSEQLKYIMGQKVEDVKTPLKRAQQRDLLPLLNEMERHPPQTRAEQEARTRDLATIHDSVAFETNPTVLG